MSGKGTTVGKQKAKLLIIGDAVAHTGFSTVLHNIADRLKGRYDISVLGINYYGDPHSYGYPIYPAATGGDLFGLGRLEEVIRRVTPNVVLIINDPWICKDYVEILKKYPEIKVALYMPVDSPNMSNDFVKVLNQAALAIPYTKFADDELRKGGLIIPSTIIPHGIDTAVFHPLSKEAARKELGIPQDWFIVGNVSRNQPRKRIDLLIRYFALWAKDKPDNVKLYYHGSLRDMGWNILQLCQYYGVHNRLIITNPNITPAVGVEKNKLNLIYNVFDVHAMTTMGEGWGLPTAESMACGIPNILPRWSAFNEWCRKPDGEPVVEFVECTSTFTNTGGINTIGGIADEQLFVAAFEKMYTDAAYRKNVGNEGYKLIKSTKFTWNTVANQFDQALRGIVNVPDNKPQSN